MLPYPFGLNFRISLLFSSDFALANVAVMLLNFTKCVLVFDVLRGWDTA